MANEDQLSILRQGVEVWNKWRAENLDAHVDLSGADLGLANLNGANLKSANLGDATLIGAYLNDAVLSTADLRGADLSIANLNGASLRGAYLSRASLSGADLRAANLAEANLVLANLSGADLIGSNFLKAVVGATVFGNLDLSDIVGLEHMVHTGPSSISTDTFALSKGKISEVFLKGCGLSDWQIEIVKLYNPELSNGERNTILYQVYDATSEQALQISLLFISYSHADNEFVDKLEGHLNEKGIRFWRDIHEMKAGRIEKQLDQAISQNRTVLLILSENSLKSDWVEHEVRTARGLEKEIGRDVLCPIALDNSWKDSQWPKWLMAQIMEYNILDFSAWKDDSKFDSMFRKLIDGLELFYKG